MSMSGGRHILLPEEHEAQALFDEYSGTMGLMHHITHTATIQHMIGQVYDSVRRSESVAPCQVALILSILASGAYFSTSQPDATSNLFPSAGDPAQFSTFWRTWALDVLDQNRRMASMSVEDVQATLIIAVLSHNMDGSPARFRILASIAASIARSLELHTIDSPDRKSKRPMSVQEVIDTEVKRRVWWHIVVSDWLMANIAGPQQGIYTIQPRHFMVNLPRNLNDEDLELGEAAVERDHSTPTVMSYYLARARGAELSRQVVDFLPMGFSASAGIGTVDYNDVVEFERRCASYSNDEIPVFLRLDDESCRRSEDTHARFPQLRFQRSLINLGLHYGRMRMHRPYLVRAAAHPRYDFSRAACLDAARKTLHIWRAMLDTPPGPPGGASPSRIAVVLHHMFTATLILALDLCFSPPAAAVDEARGWNEVRAACRSLELAAEESAVARKFLAPLMDVLRRHHQDQGQGQERPRRTDVRLDEVGMQPPPPPPSQRQQTDVPHTPVPCIWLEEACSDAGDSVAVAQPAGFQLAMPWKDMLNFAPNPDVVNLDQLFASLDACYTF
ncbi:hypothetical protein MBLNU459_g5945t2 [Dothideomycetes sp. NU459]